MCRLCSQPGAVCVYASVCSGVQCVSVSGSGPAPAPLSLCVFVCADLFQQFSFGQALGASSLSAPVWTQKPLTTFDSVNILAPFNMQPELLCKDEEWGEGRGVMGGKRGGGFGDEGGSGCWEEMFLEFDIDGMRGIRVTKTWMEKKNDLQIWQNSPNFLSFMFFSLYL